MREEVNIMEKKYEMFKEKETDTLFRIRALKDFGCTTKGDVGGYIENETNLSQEGTCWVGDKAIVRGNANVSDDAKVLGKAIVRDNAKVSGCATVCHYAIVYGNALICDDAIIGEWSRVYGAARVSGQARTCGNTHIHGNAVVNQQMWTCFSEVTDDLTKNIKMSLRTQCNLQVKDDYVIAYKLVRKNLSSIYDENFFYKIGELIEAKEPEESTESCASGLHFSHLTYWDNCVSPNLSDYLYLKAKIKLEDIITIQSGKIRCRKAEILESFEP